MSTFTGRVALVTGAAGNLGGSVVQAFIEVDANVVAVDRAGDRLPKIFPELVNHPGHLLVTSVDSNDEIALKGLAAKIMGRFGRIDILVNTVGGYRAGTPVHETPLETLDSLIDLNVRTALIASQAVIPYMLAQGSGKIVSVAARAGLTGRKNMGAYSSSKAAVLRLTESMAAELKDVGINVNCVLPGTIDTPQNREAMPRANYDRWVKPESLADVILFLASDAARDIHGAAVPVYGRS